MAITLHGVAASPADNGASTATQITITPPASMQIGDLVYVRCLQRGSATFSVGVTGGQTWNALTRATESTTTATQAFWCVFNGTWGANPRFDFSAGTNTTAVMLVFRPTSTAYTFAIDTAESTASFAAAATITITGRTPANASNVSIASWATADDNTWGSLSGANWSKTGLTAQYRNTSGSDSSLTFAYQIQTAAAATNNVAQTQATLGNDAGVQAIVTFYEFVATINASTAAVDAPDVSTAAASLPAAGSAALVDAPDVSTSAVSLPAAGSAALVDAPDVSTSNATVGLAGFRSVALLELGGIASTGPAPLNASAALFDAPDVSTAAASLPVAGSAALVDVADLVAAAASASAGADAALQDQPDKLEVAASLAIGASAALQDGADLVASAGSLAVAAAAALVDAPDLVAATATSGAVSAGFRSVALLELGGIASLSGPPPINASAVLVDTPDRVVSTAGPGVLLTSIEPNAAYRITAVADLEVGDRIDVVSAVGGPVSEVTINPDATFAIAPGSTITDFDIRVWSLTDQAWYGPATQSLGLQVNAALQDSADLVAAAVATPITGSASLVDVADQVAASASSGATGISAALFDAPDAMSGVVAITVTGSAALFDALDQITATAGEPVTIGSAALVDAIDQILAAVGTPAATYALLVEAPDLLESGAPLFYGPGYTVSTARRFEVCREVPRSFTLYRYPPRAWSVETMSCRVFEHKDPGERVKLTFDFTSELPAGVTISGVFSNAATVEVVRGVDATPADILNGAPSVDGTGKKIIVPVKDGLAGRDYKVSVLAVTTDPLLRPELDGVLPVRA